MLILITLILGILSAFLYRVGGMSKQQAKEDMPWLPQWMINTKARDIGCALLTLIWTISFVKFPANTQLWKIIASHTICFFGTFGALTTYWDSLFGYDDFYAHGFVIALAKVSFAVVTGNWIAWGLYVVLTSFWMGILSKIDWSKKTKGKIPDDYGDELSRGLGTIILLPLILI